MALQKARDHNHRLRKSFSLGVDQFRERHSVTLYMKSCCSSSSKDIGTYDVDEKARQFYAVVENL